MAEPARQALLATFEAEGFDPRTAGEIIGTVSRHVSDALAERGRSPRSSAASSADEQVIATMRDVVRHASVAVRGLREDAAARRLPVLRSACDQGCAHCCWLHVSISAPEALVLAAFLRDTLPADALEALRARVESTSARVRALDATGRVAARVPCPLLDPDEQTCGAYPVRPLSCAGATSLDAEACARAVAGDGTGEIPIEPLQHGAIRAVRAGLSAGLEARGLDARRYELASALAIALRVPDAASRYLAGERLFETAGTAADAG